MSTSELTAHDQELLADLELLRGVPKVAADLVRASFTARTLGFGEVAVRAGDAADAFYVLSEGRLRAVVTADNGDELTLGRLAPGAAFGEMGVLTGQPRQATVRASEPARLLRLDGGVLRGLAATVPLLERRLRHVVMRREAVSLLRVDGPFAGLDEEAIDELLDTLTPLDVPKGAALINEGDREGPLFVITAGAFSVSRLGEQVARVSAGDVVGERAVLTGARRDATVTAASDARVLALAAEDVVRLGERHPAFRACLDAVRLAHERASRTSDHTPASFVATIDGPADPPSDTMAGAVDITALAVPDTASSDQDQATGRPRRPRRRRRFHLIPQVDSADCGAACLAMIARHHGKRVSLSRARTVARVSVEGATLAGLAEGGRALGFDVQAIKASKRNLDQVSLPAVAHWEGVHWLVVHRVTDEHVHVADPGIALLRMTREEFDERWTGYLALLTPTEVFDELEEDRSSLRWMLPFARREARALSLATALAVLISLVQLSIPEATRRVFDDVLGQGRQELLLPTVITIVAAVLLIGVAALLRGWFLASSALRIDAATLNHVSDRLLRLPMSYFHARRTGDLQRRLTGTRQIRAFLVAVAQTGLTSALTLLVSVAYMVANSWQLTLIWLAAVPIYLTIMRLIVVHIKPLLGRLEDATGQYSSRQIDGIKGIETIKATGAEDRYHLNMAQEFDRLAGKQLDADLGALASQAMTRWTGLLVTAGYLWVGARLVLDGADASGNAFTVGQFVAFQTIMAFATEALLSLLELFDSGQMISVLGERLHDVLSNEPEQTDEEQRQKVAISGHVVVDHLTFRFGGEGSAPILDDLSFEVTPGTNVAIVGRSGSGKTTLVKCLAGILTPSQGDVLFDGRSIDTLDLPHLRAQIGFVLQESHLFSDTVGANISFGEETPDENRIRWAATVASAHDFLAALPMGYATRVGEGGVQLSGGQRQRVSIARAVYREPKILILDEATSALDTEAERSVQSNLERLLAGRTSFVIAHRLSTVRNADVIFVLEKGRIVERGTHEELMSRDGLYRHLAGQQLSS